MSIKRLKYTGLIQICTSEQIPHGGDIIADGVYFDTNILTDYS